MAACEQCAGIAHWRGEGVAVKLRGMKDIKVETAESFSVWLLKFCSQRHNSGPK